MHDTTKLSAIRMFKIDPYGQLAYIDIPSKYFPSPYLSMPSENNTVNLYYRMYFDYLFTVSPREYVAFTTYLDQVTNQLQVHQNIPIRNTEQSISVPAYNSIEAVALQNHLQQKLQSLTDTMDLDPTYTTLKATECLQSDIKQGMAYGQGTTLPQPELHYPERAREIPLSIEFLKLKKLIQNFVTEAYNQQPTAGSWLYNTRNAVFGAIKHIMPYVDWSKLEYDSELLDKLTRERDNPPEFTLISNLCEELLNVTCDKDTDLKIASNSSTYLNNLLSSNKKLEIVGPQKLILDIKKLTQQLNNRGNWHKKIFMRLQEHKEKFLASSSSEVIRAHTQNCISSIKPQKALIEHLEYEQRRLEQHNPIRALETLLHDIASGKVTMSTEAVLGKISQALLWQRNYLYNRLLLEQAKDELAFTNECQAHNYQVLCKNDRQMARTAQRVITPVALVASGMNLAAISYNDGQSQAQVALQQPQITVSQQSINSGLHRTMDPLLENYLKNQDNFASSINKDWNARRIQSANATLGNGGAITQKSLNMSTFAQQMAIDIGIEPSVLLLSEGNEFTHAIHQECVDLLNQISTIDISKLDPQSIAYQSIESAKKNIKFAIESRNQNDIIQANQYTSKAYEFFYGAAQQLKDDAIDMFTNMPIQTVAAVATHSAVVGVGTAVGGPVGGVVAETALTAVQLGLGAQAAKENIAELGKAIQEGNGEQIGRNTVLTFRDVIMLGRSVNNGKRLFFGKPLKHDYHHLAIVDPINQDKKIRIANLVNQGPRAVLKNGYYEVNGFKFSEYYYNYLWKNGRSAPSLVAKEILDGANFCLPDTEKSGFFRYEFGGWEMIYNPVTREIWHLQPMKQPKK